MSSTSRYRGAVIASSDDTLIATREDDETLHLVPTKDVNFELLAKSARVSDSPALSYWDVVAVGERLEAAVVVSRTAVEASAIFSAHAALSPWRSGHRRRLRGREGRARGGMAQLGRFLLPLLLYFTLQMVFNLLACASRTYLVRARAAGVKPRVRTAASDPKAACGGLQLAPPKSW